jgi:NitT/TauT family transport system permease protein
MAGAAEMQTYERAIVPPQETTPVMRRLLRRSRIVFVLVATIVAWQVVVQALELPRYLLPSPEQILTEFTEKPGVVLNALFVTATEAALGFLCAAFLGILLAILIARSALMEEMLYPYLNIIRVTPVLAIAPLLTIWFGHTMTPIVIVATLIAFFPIVVTTVLGLRSVDPDLINLMRTLSASERDVLRKIRFPNAMPYIFSSFRISAPLAVVGALVGEFVGAAQGLGYLLVTARGRIDTGMVFLMVVLSAALGIAFFMAVVFVERRFIKWHPSIVLE